MRGQNKTTKINFYLTTLKLLKEGLNPHKISKKLNVSKQRIAYYIRKLKDEGQIINNGYGVWEVKEKVKKSTKACPSLKGQVRGHAFNWRVKLMREFDWVKHLRKNNISYSSIGINKSTPRIIIKEKKVWLTKTGLVIYEPKSFFSDSSMTSKGMAVNELDKTIKAIEKLLHLNFGAWSFTTSREHYGLIKNELARQYNDKGDKLYINDSNGVWLWIDDSHSLAELETKDPNINRQVQLWYNDLKKNNFDINATDIKNLFFKQQQEINLLKEKLTNPTLAQSSPFVIPSYIN